MDNLSRLKRRVISKSDIIACPACKAHILKAKRDIFTGDRILPDDFEKLQESLDTRIGSRMECGDCGADFVNTQLFLPFVLIPGEQCEHP